MDSLSQSIPISFLCTHFKVSRSGYYSWKNSVGTRNECRDIVVKAIKEEFEMSGGTYGSPRIQQCLQDREIPCSINTVAKIMREEGIKVKNKKKFTPKTTDSNHNSPIAPREFKSEQGTPDFPNKVWAGDITYILVGKVFYYLSVVMDLFNREIVGWSIDKTLEAKGVVAALKNAIITQGADVQIIFHSDRGSQYASILFRNLLNEEEFIPSMSRKGNCYDNCYVESFFATLKKDIKTMGVILTEDNIRSEIFKYIEVWYNRKRKHSSLGNMNPHQFKIKMENDLSRWPGLPRRGRSRMRRPGHQTSLDGMPFSC